MSVTVSVMQIKMCSADLLNIEAQYMDIVIAMINSSIMYLGVDETTGQVPLMTVTNILSYW